VGLEEEIGEEDLIQKERSKKRMTMMMTRVKTVK
jgi:hypothetical protein